MSHVLEAVRCVSVGLVETCDATNAATLPQAHEAKGRRHGGVVRVRTTTTRIGVATTSRHLVDAQLTDNEALRSSVLATHDAQHTIGHHPVLVT
jgi:hypothetical protein